VWLWSGKAQVRWAFAWGSQSPHGNWAMHVRDRDCGDSGNPCSKPGSTCSAILDRSLHLENGLGGAVADSAVPEWPDSSTQGPSAHWERNCRGAGFDNLVADCEGCFVHAFDRRRVEEHGIAGVFGGGESSVIPRSMWLQLASCRGMRLGSERVMGRGNGGRHVLASFEESRDDGS